MSTYFLNFFNFFKSFFNRDIFLYHILAFQFSDLLSYILECCTLTFFCQHLQKLMYKCRCLRMDHLAKLRRPFLLLLKRLFVCILITQISFGCCDPVHKHLIHILYRHLLSYNPLSRNYTVINPVCIMMLITTFVMQPRCRISGCFTFCIIRASCSLIILTTDQKFCRRIFGQIMKQPLLV